MKIKAPAGYLSLKTLFLETKILLSITLREKIYTHLIYLTIYQYILIDNVKILTIFLQISYLKDEIDKDFPLAQLFSLGLTNVEVYVYYR